MVYKGTSDPRRAEAASRSAATHLKVDPIRASQTSRNGHWTNRPPATEGKETRPPGSSPLVHHRGL